nr:pentatricopeptide repeat-containing protein At4g19191, mitochondrial [Ipomoea batatas]
MQYQPWVTMTHGPQCNGPQYNDWKNARSYSWFPAGEEYMVKPVATPILNRLTNRSSIANWNCSIREAVNHGQSQKALLVFRGMKQNGVEPNNFTFPFVAKACAKLSNFEYSQLIHAQILKYPCYSDMFVQTAMIDMYVKCGKVDLARVLFDRMPERDIASWNAIIIGYVQIGFVDPVSCLFERMVFDGIRPDSVTVMGLTRLVSSLKDIRLLSAIHSFGIRIGFESDVSVANTWVAAYAKCGDLDSAHMVFNGIGSKFVTVVSWNAMIAGCACVGNSCKAMQTYQQMLHCGFGPDLSTILNMLSSCTSPEAFFQGTLIHAHSIQVGCDADVSVLNTTISMYSKCGDLYSARLTFDTMTDKTCVSWTALIGGYAEKGDLDEALALFTSMEAAGEKPDMVTLTYLISACGQVGALEIGREMERYATLNGLKSSNVMVCNALLDMYGKCGNMTDAQELFCSMEEKTIVSWTTMIAGYALNGKSREALDNFQLLLDSGIKPNHITFLAVLQACNHAGFLKEGWEFFDMMTKVYRINPSLDHYACMADLLGRCGRLQEALEFVQNMPMESDFGIWGSLLSACKIHRSLEIGEYAAQRLFEMEPQRAAPYVEMANIYASARRWDGVAAIRTRMKCNQVSKSPGQSLIHVNGKGCTFTVEDRCHTGGHVIYETLNSLALQLNKEFDFSWLEGFL